MSKDSKSYTIGEEAEYLITIIPIILDRMRNEALESRKLPPLELFKYLKKAVYLLPRLQYIPNLCKAFFKPIEFKLSKGMSYNEMKKSPDISSHDAYEQLILDSINIKCRIEHLMNEFHLYRETYDYFHPDVIKLMEEEINELLGDFANTQET